MQSPQFDKTKYQYPARLAAKKIMDELRLAA